MAVSLTSYLPGGFALLARGKPGAAPAPAASSATAATGDAPAAASPTSPLPDTEGSLRAMREEFLGRRLQTAEKIVEAMRPFLGLVTTATTARPMAVTLGFVAREINSVVRDMGKELDRRAPAAAAGAAAVGAEPDAGAFKQLAALSQQAERTMTSVSRMLRVVSSVPDPDPLGRGTVQSVAAESSRSLLRGWEDLKSFRTRLTAAQSRTNLIA